jgi:hypothetical protein
MKIALKSESVDVANQAGRWEKHRLLAEFNLHRLNPCIVDHQWQRHLLEDFSMLLFEGDLLESERKSINHLALDAPREPLLFLNWFEALKERGPGQHDGLFDFLETKANLSQMKWFIQQEVAGEAGFDDLTALTQIKMPMRAKLEIARNYWDEMGRGKEFGMHALMLADVASELGILPLQNSAEIVPESLALGNILLGLAANRRYAFQSVGALGAVELTAPARAEKIYRGLNRLGVSLKGQRYYLLHSSIDIKHSQSWNSEVIYPLVKNNFDYVLPIAEGALMRLKAGAQCFERYRKELSVA